MRCGEKTGSQREKAEGVKQAKKKITHWSISEDRNS